MSRAGDCIYEGETILLYCPEASGYLFSQPYSPVSIYQVKKSYSSRDPAIPNIHFVSFKVFPEYDHEYMASLASSTKKKSRAVVYETIVGEKFVRSLVYGRKVKLQHVATRKYLSLRKDKSSTNVIVTLFEQPDANSLFRIRPAKEGKHIGEDILSDDQIKLECVQQKGYHLLCTKSALTERVELKLSINDSSFTISPINTCTNIPQKAVRGGSVITLLHSELEGHVTGNGPILADSLPEEIKRKMDDAYKVSAKKQGTYGISQEQSDSGDCFWQLEKSENPLCGDQFQYKEKCRIKHLLTQHYLAVTKTNQISLKKLQSGHEKDSDVDFYLWPVKEETGDILNGCCVELRHVKTAMNLNMLGKEDIHVTEDPDGASDSVEEIDSKGKHSYRLSLEDSDSSENQTFKLEEVNEEIIREFYQVNGISATLADHIQKLTKDAKVFIHDLSGPQDVLDNLHCWLRDAATSKRKADMLRIVRGVDLLFGFLYKIDKISEKKVNKGQLVQLCNKICQVLCRYIKVANRECYLYITDHRFVDILARKIGCGMGVEEVLSIIVQSGSDITETIVTLCDKYIKHVKLDATTMDFLSTLCFTSGKPVRSLQNKIRRYIIEAKIELFFHAKVVDDKVCFIHPERLEGQPITAICSKDTAEANSEDFKFYVAQLKLFSRVCKGVNFKSIREIVYEHRYIDFELSLLVLKDPDVHPLLQSAYLDFVISAYVDVIVQESGADINNLWHSYNYDQLNLKAADMTGTDDTFDSLRNVEEMRELTEWISGTLQRNDTLYAEETVLGNNELIEQTLSVMQTLVSYGFYQEPSRRDGVVKALQHILDGKNDKPYEDATPKEAGAFQQRGSMLTPGAFQQRSRSLTPGAFQKRGSTPGAFQQRSRGSSPGPFQQRSRGSSPGAFQKRGSTPGTFRRRGSSPGAFQKRGRYESNENNKRLFRIKARAIEVLHLFFKQHCSTANVEIISMYKSLKDDSTLGSKLPNTELKHLIQETFELNNHDRLVTIAREQLHTLLQQHALSYFDFNKPEGKELIAILLDLLKYDNDTLNLSSCKLLFDIHQEEDILLKNCKLSYLIKEHQESSMQLYEQILKLGHFKDEHKVLLHMQQGKATKEQIEETLETISRICVVGDDESVPHQCNQRIVFSTGVFSALLNYVVSCCSEPDDESEQEILSKAVYVLIRAVRRNEMAQKWLFEYFMKLVEAKSAISPVAQLLTETITDNVILCRKITEGDIRKIFRIAACSSHAKPEYYEFCTTLVAIMKVSKVSPLLSTNNQELMAHLFSDHCDQFGMIMEKAGRRRRQNVLRAKDDKSQLVQLLALSDLLAAAADGDHKFCEDICQGIFEIDELISILSDPLIPYERKKPFANLLGYVYLLTERNSLVAIATLVEKVAFWKHVESCSVLMTAIKDTLHESDKKEQIRIQVKALMTQFISVSTWKSMSQSMFGEVLECDSVEHAVPLNAILFYIVEGLVPLLSVFCTQLASHNSAAPTSEFNLISGLLQPEIVEILRNFGQNIAKLLLDQQTIFLSSPEHVHNWVAFLDSLVSILPDVDSLYEIKRRISASGPAISKAEQEYILEYNEEICVNRELNWFIENYRLAYEGRLINGDVVLESDELIPKDVSFERLTKLFNEVTTRGKAKRQLPQVQHLLHLLNVFYRQLQQPQTSQERRELNKSLLKCLQLLSGVVYTHINKLPSQQGKDDAEFVTYFNREYEAEVKPIQDALIDMNSHKKAMLHLSYSNDEVAIQVLGFLRVLLYNGNEYAQTKIGEMCSSKDIKFFQKANKLLDNVTVRFGFHGLRKSEMKLKIIIEDESDVYNLEDLEDGYDDDDDDDASEGSQELGRASRSASAIQSLKQILRRASRNYKPVPQEEPSEDWDTASTDGIAIHESIKSHGIKVAGQLEATKSEAAQQASVVLDVVAALCDGQNVKMQDILREQKFSFSSVNIVRQVAVLLQNLAEHVNEKTLNIMAKNIQALIEMCAGNFANQETIFKGHVVDSINLILKYLVENNALLFEETAEMELQVMCSSIELLQVMLEETNEKISELAQGISNDLGVFILLQAMLQLENCASEFEDLRADATKGLFKGFHVLKNIADYLDISVEAYSENFSEMIQNLLSSLVKTKVPSKLLSSEMTALLEHVKRHTRSIEIKYQSEEDAPEILTRVYFEFNPARELSSKQKEIIKDNIARESPEEKRKDLLNWMKAVRRNVEYEKSVSENSWLNWITRFSDFRNYLLIFLTLLLNAFVLFLFTIPDNIRAGGPNDTNETLTVYFPQTPNWFYGILWPVGGIHAILSLWMVAEFFVKEKPNIIWTIPSVQKIIFQLKELIYRSHQLGMIFNITEKPINNLDIAECFEQYFLSFAPLYRIIFLLCSIAALATKGYFYCGCILYVLMGSEVLLNILTAVRRSAYQLLSVLLLGLAVLLVYAVITFFVLSDYFDPGPNDGSYTYCSSLIECYVTVIREGLLDTLGSGIALEYVGQPGPDFTKYWLRTIFDLSFFIIVTTVGLNIVVAILVDRFSELRQERDDVKADKLSSCFICGISSDEFDRNAKGFKDHVINDHSKWNYIYFYLHLCSMLANDHNALEKYVFDKIERQQFDFFPLHEAKVFSSQSKT